MRGLVRVRIVEKDKRAEPIDVTKFLDTSQITCDEAFSAEGIVETIADCIQYVPDDKKDFWKFPIETIRDEIGDCEDGAILTAVSMLDRKIAPYYEILVNVFDTGTGFHAAVTLFGKLMDWTRPSIRNVPPDWKLYYCFNKKHAYTTWENALKWRS